MPSDPCAEHFPNAVRCDALPGENWALWTETPREWITCNGDPLPLSQPSFMVGLVPCLIALAALGWRRRG